METKFINNGSPNRNGIIEGWFKCLINLNNLNNINTNL